MLGAQRFQGDARIGVATGDRYFGYLVLCAASIALLAYVGVYSRNVPYFEDWVLVPVLSGSRPFSLSWLVEMTVAEHRFILAKALLYPMFLAGGGDFRLPMFVDAIALIMLALACMATARRLRGSASFADAFFPLTLLSICHGENTLFFVQVFFVAPVALLITMMLLIASGRWPGRAGLGALLAACLVLMPLNGGIGMMIAVPLVLWFAFAAWLRQRTGTAGGDRDAALMLCALLATVALAGLYFVGYHPPPPVEAQARTWPNAGVIIVQVLSLAFGAGGRDVWPWLGCAVAFTCIASACVLAAIVASRPDERLRASGLLACLAASLLVAAAIGYGRAGIGPGAGLPARYALLISPALVCVFLTAVLYAGPVTGRLAQTLFFAVACAMLVPNIAAGIEYARYRTEIADAVLEDIAAGMPSAALAQRHGPKLLPDNDALEARFEMLRTAGIGPFAGVRPAIGELHEIPVPVVVVGTHDAQVSGGVVRGSGPDPYIVLALHKRIYVEGIRVRFTLTSEGGNPASLQAFWMLTGRDTFDAQRRNVTVSVASGPQEQTVTFWVYDTVDHLRLDPDVGASVFHPIEIVLLAKA